MKKVLFIILSTLLVTFVIPQTIFAAEVQSISKLGRLDNANVVIYQDLSNNTSTFKAGSSNIDKVFYVKKQSNWNGQLYYLISNHPNSGQIGWVKSSDLLTQNHVGVDKKQKVLYVKGTGWAYSKAWGAGKDVVYKDLSLFKDQKFNINLTEKVGNYIWHRGTLDGKLIWIIDHNLKSQPTEQVNATSKLGRVKINNSPIYEDYKNLSKSFIAGTTYTDRTFYIKKQIQYKGHLYYRISTSPRSGEIGWVDAEDMVVHPHIGVDNKKKTVYLKGTGWTYTDAWGAAKDVVHKDLSLFKGQEFNVNLTEKVGDYTWYRGTLDGKQMWVISHNVTNQPTQQVTSTSKLGRIQNVDAPIYEDYKNTSKSIEAGEKYTDKIFYIKKQVQYNGELYYRISTTPRSGEIGWVKAEDMWAQIHVGVDNKKKTFYLKGTGLAYTDAWGAGKDVVYDDLSPYKNYEFEVNLTEKVGEYIWYRGYLNGQLLWIRSANATVEPSYKIVSTSKLGRIQSNDAEIYNNINDLSKSFKAGTTYTEKVFYIKREVLLDGQLYYQISTAPRSGVVGWIKASNVWAQDHVTIDSKQKKYYLKGSGMAYTDAWGSSKDVVYWDLNPFQNQEFNIILTEKVGEYIWYRGYINNQLVWVRAGNINEVDTRYTNYNMTFQEALKKQMGANPPPQTDEFRNKNAFISAAYVEIEETGAISGSGVRLRTAPVFDDKNIYATVGLGTKITILEKVKGDLHAGTTEWFKIKYDNQILYVHTSLANPNAKVAKTTTRVNIRESASDTSHVYATVNAGTTVNIVEEGTEWHKISYGTWRNAKLADVEYLLNPNNLDQFQHLVLSGSAGVTEAELRNLLFGKGTLSGTEKTFIEASKAYNINEAYLVAHTLLETGHGRSELAKGVEVGKNKNGTLVLVTSSNRSSLTDIKKVYNMFGIAAYDNSAVSGGATKAYQEGWTSPEKAIDGGAKWISQNYVNSSKYNQNTLYKMKWNPSTPGTHQYATDIGWVQKQISNIKEVYESLPNATLRFDIPRYK